MVQAASAQLTSLDEGAWLGWFIGKKSRNGVFGITSQGEMIFNPIDEAVRARGGRSFRMMPAVEEQRPNGKPIIREMDP